MPPVMTGPWPGTTDAGVEGVDPIEGSQRPVEGAREDQRGHVVEDQVAGEEHPGIGEPGDQVPSVWAG